MNRIKLLMVACLLGMAATASAQFANSKGSSSQGGDMSGWQGLRVSYHPMSLSPDKGDNIGITGFSAGYVKGFGLSQSTPIFLEVGANLLWTSKDLTEDEDTDYSEKLNMFSVNIPVNFGYKYTVNDKFSIYPYIGLNFRVNVVGKVKTEDEGESKSTDVFNKDDMKKNGMGEVWKRFQAGWQIGVAFNLNKFTLAASYGKDFTEISKKVKVSMPSITLGLNF
nr:outer membrane beta-barrel protein [Bacteroides intestinalis]